jgi:hypothetical protein
MNQATRRAALAVVLGVCCSAQPASAAFFQEFVATGQLLSGQSTSDSSSTTIVFPGPLDVETAMSVVSQVGFNVNADAAPDQVAVELGQASFDVAFSFLHTQSFDLILQFDLRGQLLRVADQPGCLGSISLADIPIPTLVRVNDGAEFPIGAVLEGDTLDLGDTTEGKELSRHVELTINFRNQPVAIDGYRMSFLIFATAISQSCEVSARFGAGNGSTTGCDACEYPGFGDRELATDGIFVTVTKISLCGNGTVDPGEDCDLGINNGSDGTCCTAFCEHVFAGRLCRPAAGECDQDETCTGDSGDCLADVKRSPGSPCTPDQSLCTDDICNAGGECAHPPRADASCDANECVCDDDGLFCNGLVRCANGGGLCVRLPAPCAEDDTCDEDRDLCLSPEGTPRATATPTEAATGAPATPTATPPAAGCPGDCDNDRMVVISELVLGVNIALDLQPTSECPAFDGNGDGSVAINELIAAVTATLVGCPT